MKLLKASLTTCPRCQGARHGCGWCSGKGYHVHDRSYEDTTDQRARHERIAQAVEPLPASNQAEEIVAEVTRPIRVQLRKKRLEDGVCVDCGNRDLASRHRCQPCAEKYNETSAASMRKSRASEKNDSPI